jgi:hypothetical protein
MRSAPHAIPRALPWRYLLTLVGTIATLGGGIVAVSTPALGGGIFTFGILALIAGTTD